MKNQDSFRSRNTNDNKFFIFNTTINNFADNNIIGKQYKTSMVIQNKNKVPSPGKQDYYMSSTTDLKKGKKMSTNKTTSITAPRKKCSLDNSKSADISPLYTPASTDINEILKSRDNDVSDLKNIQVEFKKRIEGEARITSSVSGTSKILKKTTAGSSDKSSSLSITPKIKPSTLSKDQKKVGEKSRSLKSNSLFNMLPKKLVETAKKEQKNCDEPNATDVTVVQREMSIQSEIVTVARKESLEIRKEILEHKDTSATETIRSITTQKETQFKSRRPDKLFPAQTLNFESHKDQISSPAFERILSSKKNSVHLPISPLIAADIKGSRRGSALKSADVSGICTPRRELIANSQMASPTRSKFAAATNFHLSPQGAEVSSHKAKSSNIKVVCRFRPLNDVELELCNNGVGTECCNFPESSQSVHLPSEGISFTFDHVFSPVSMQKDVFEAVGLETIDDVLAGYNGTIFTYGQTVLGSGKSFTMFGPNIYDEELMGIIPRAVSNIFDHIEQGEMEVDYQLRCSMLEIYRENLRDLLSIDKRELKIKESPRRGIYVDGLREEYVTSEEEVMAVLEMGEQMRSVASTRMNQSSSRSHTVFTLELTQIFPNGVEKRGILNLVDLAGSEKISKSGAQGETLEEAKKINLSLSALGNVIHSLTQNSEHVPYRDSKLTRILQESLGGNYKTSLIVAASPHSNQIEETISTLKFAQRAKTIKNQVRMNIKNSPDQLQQMVDQLKEELRKATDEIKKLKTEGIVNIPEFLGAPGGHLAGDNLKNTNLKKRKSELVKASSGIETSPSSSPRSVKQASSSDKIIPAPPTPRESQIGNV